MTTSATLRGSGNFKKRKDFLLVEGFIREFLSKYRTSSSSGRTVSRIQVPPEIHPIVLNFLYLACIEWNTDESMHGLNCVFSNGNQTLQMEVGNSENSVAVGNYIISSKFHEIFEWEFMLDTIGYHSYIGFIRAPVTDNLPAFNLWLGSSNIKHKCVLQVMAKDEGAYDYVRKIPGGDTQLAPGTPTMDHGSRFKFVANFATQTCAVFVNDVCMEQNAFKDIGHEIVPIVCCTGKIAKYTFRTITPQH